MHLLDRALILFGALAGLLGVALSAAAAHLTGVSAASAASMLLAHAPAIILTGLLAGVRATNRWLARLAGLVFLVGLVLFAGDIAWRAFRGARLFANAAPAGGILLMCGWALLALAALLRRR